MRLRLLLLALVLLAAILFLPPTLGPADRVEAVEHPQSTQVRDDAHLVEGASAPTAQRSLDTWSDQALIAALVHLAGARDLFDPSLEARAADILAVPARVDRVLVLCGGTDLIGETEALALAERGAVLALGLAAGTYGRAGGAFARLDRVAFLARLLEQLPTLRPALARALVDLCERLRLGGQPVFSPAQLDTLVELRADFPHLAALLDDVVAQCVAQLDAQAREAFALLHIDGTSDPALAGLALRTLLEGPRAGSFLALAGLRLEDPGTGADLRAALLDAIGAAAPVGLAIESLVPHLDPQSLGALEQVATRRGGVEALLEAYDARLVAGGDAMERRWIVGALDGEEHTTTLFDVARSDPDRGVRGQALVTLTLGLRAPNSATLDAILLGRDQSEDPFFGLATTDSITALSNLALRAGRSDQEDLHERSLTELVDMASNPNWPARERRLARRHLEHHLTPEELAEIDAR